MTGRTAGRLRNTGAAASRTVADARLKKDYDKDVRAYDTAHEQALKLGDVLTEGIVHHFPEKFD